MVLTIFSQAYFLLMYSLVNYLFKSFACFLIVLYVFLLFCCKTSLYIPRKSAFSNICFAGLFLKVFGLCFAF